MRWAVPGAEASRPVAVAAVGSAAAGAEEVFSWSR
jgi:hypothetical protein